MDLQECRKKLDDIDAELVVLFEKRMKICGDVAEYKIRTGKAVYDAAREKEKLETVCSMAGDGFNRQGVAELFRQMMTISRRYQYRLLSEHGQEVSFGFERKKELPVRGSRIVYQGVEGAYTHGAALQYFGAGADFYHVPTWEEGMRAVQSGEADYGVFPIENSSAGAVIDNYDLLIRHQNYIVAETFLPVSHALLGLPDASKEEIKTVFSHPQALMQCANYLNSHDWKQTSMENTAIAAKWVVQDGDRSQAAIASEIAGQLYGLKVLDCPVNDNRNNTTRFIILSRLPMYRQDASKVSITFELPHKSGSLYNILGNFIFNGVNMRMIESRPIPGRNWEYRFFIDIEGNLDDAGIKNALKGIEAEAVNLRILGNY